MPLPLLDVPAAPGGASANPLLQFGFIPIIIAIMYFLVIAPARKQRKRVQEMLDALKAGDRIVTSGGLYGTIVTVGEESIRLRISPSVQVDVAKSAVTGKQPEEAA